MANLKLVPANGKYANISLGNKSYEIWKVNPRTGQEGTEVEYSVAVDLLALQPPVVSLIPEIKDGKRVAPFTQEDADRIKAAQQTGASQIRSSGAKAPVYRFDTSVVEALNESQSRVQEQEEALASMARENAQLRQQLEKGAAKEDSRARPVSPVVVSARGRGAAQAQA